MMVSGRHHSRWQHGFESRWGHSSGFQGHMGDAFVLDQPPNERRVDLAQTDMRSVDRGYGPGEAPAVAVEHRQRPQVDRARNEARVRRLGKCEGLRAGIGTVERCRRLRL
jgi:hypothetical protein